MDSTITLNELTPLRDGLVGFALGKTLSRLLSAPEWLAGDFHGRPVIEKILPPHTGHARNWTTQQLLKDRSLFILHRGQCLESAWFECAVVLATVGHLVLIDLEADGAEAGAEQRLWTLVDDADPQVRQQALGLIRGLVGRDGLLEAVHAPPA